MIGFCAALCSVAMVDDTAHPAEMRMMQQTIDDSDLVMAGIIYHRAVGSSELLSQLDERFDRKQKLCVLANMMAMAMVDGAIRGAELALLRHAAQTFAINKDDFGALYDVLLLKNNTSIFSV